ncbi:hypothetical protein ACFVWR_07060 [Leifsonia sp. NPDC058292]|uniref:hypothetical protein n=1 Tax=Leifsonia sp. NPDC058292 TaxID=3346428 RepID=UPI0036DBB5E5
MNRRKLVVAASIVAVSLVLAGAGTWGGVAYATSSAEHDLDAANTALSKSYRADAAVVKAVTTNRAAAK